MSEQVVVECRECGEENTASARYCCLCRSNIFKWGKVTDAAGRPVPTPGPTPGSCDRAV